MDDVEEEEEGTTMDNVEEEEEREWRQQQQRQFIMEEEKEQEWQQQQLINRQQIKATIVQGIRTQAFKMLRYSIPERQVLKMNPSINDCVTIPIPSADRLCKMSMNNILGIIIEVIPFRPSTGKNRNNSSASSSDSGKKSSNSTPSPSNSFSSDRNLYDIATKHGRLKPLLSRSQFEICRHRNLLDISEVSTNCIISLREAALKTNIIADDCIVIPTKCHCVIDFCRTRRCICKRANILCNKKCLCNNSRCINT